MVDGVEGVRPPSPPDGDYGRADLAAPEPIAGQAHQAGAVDQGLHFGADVGEIGGRADDDGIGLGHLGDDLVAGALAWMQRRSLVSKHL